MVGLIFSPDTTWKLQQVNERFTMPYDAHPAQVVKNGNLIARAAIALYESKRHWKFRDDLGVTLDESELQIDITDYSLSSPLSSNPLALEHTHLMMKKAEVAYVMKMWFEVPVITVVQEMDDDLTQEHLPEGFVSEDEINPTPKVEAMEFRKTENGN